MIELSQYDTARQIRDTLKINDQPLNLTGATVKLLVRPHTAKKPTVEYDVSLSGTPTDGGVTVAPTDEMMEQSGLFEVKWKSTLSNGKVVFIPTVGYDLMMIYPTTLPLPPTP